MGTIAHDSETPAHGQQVITACAFIYYDFDGVVKVFMPKRADTKKFLPGLYELPGGHIDYGEDVVDGLQREIMEELHMTVTIGDPFTVFTYINEVKGSHSIEVVYFAQFVEPIAQITIQPEDHSRYDWFGQEEVVQHKAEITPESQVISSGEEDPEYLAILRGFALLDGEPLHF